MLSSKCNPIVLCGLLLAASMADAQHRLDLTEEPLTSRSPREGSGVSAGVRGIEGQAPPRLPIEVYLDWVDQTELVLGRSIVTEVTVRNAGRSAILLPWSATRHPSIDGELLERRLHITLAWADQKGRRHPLAVVALFGSSERNGSLLELAPGETATIRAATSLTASTFEPNTVLSLAPRLFNLSAVVHVAVSPADWAEPVVSTNAIPITLRIAGRNEHQH